MLWTTLKIAWRHLRHHPVLSTINVAGLAVGIAVCVLLLLTVRSEWTFDRFHAHGDRIVRITRTATAPSGDRSTEAITPARLANALRESVPGIASTVRLGRARVQMTQDDATFRTRALFADSTFFQIFSFPLLHGPPDALAAPRGAVLSASTARRLFGTTDAVGRPLQVRIENETLEATIQAVAQDPPRRSSIQFDLILPFDRLSFKFNSVLREAAMTRWDFPVAATLALLRPNADRDAVAQGLQAVAASHYPEARRRASREADPGETRIMGEDATTRQVTLNLQPLADVHLTPEVNPVAVSAPSDPMDTYLLGLAALLILSIAAINFTTLALGRSAGRAREVGVRKALGAHAGNVRLQFWGEAVLTSSLALGVGVVLAHWSLPVFNRMTDADVAFVLSPTIGLGLLGLAAVVGLVAGSYPAVVLSRFTPTGILRGTASLGRRSRLISGLVTVQFVLSMLLVTGTAVISEQLEYMQNDLGFESESLVRIYGFRDTSLGAEQAGPLRNTLQQQAGVQSVGTSLLPFFEETGLSVSLEASDSGEGDGQASARVLPVDSTFLETMGMAVTQGNSFASGVPSKRAVVVNNAFVQEMGWTDPVGRTIDMPPSSLFGRALGTATVHGVVSNAHTRSMHHIVRPTLFVPASIFGGSVGAMYVRTAPGADVSGVREAVTAALPGTDAEVTGMADVVAEAYATERQWQSLMRWAAGLALAIACVGLFGLAALAVAQRRREIGIRKTVGASSASVVRLFLRALLPPAGAAVGIALPLAYWGAHRWLSIFPYRIDLAPTLFVGTAAAVLGIAALTVATQAWRATRIDPAATLREE